MKKIILPVVVLAVLLFSVLLSYSDPLIRESAPAAARGIMDLSTWDFTKKGPVSLSGEWACYDGQLLSPGDFSGAGGQTPRLTGYVDLTAGRIGGNSQKLLRPKGIRTYRLLVRTAPSPQTYGLTVDNIDMNSRLYVNGILQGEQGVPALKGHGYEQRQQVYTAYFQLHGGEEEILLQTANFDYPFAGTQYTLRFGPQNAISSSASITYAIELCGAIVSFLLAFFYLCVCLARRKDRTFLFACLEFLGFVLCFVTHGYKLIYIMFPAIPFELFSKLQALSPLIIVVTVEEYARLIRPFLPLWHVRATRFTCLLFAAAVILTPYAFYVYLTGVMGAFLTLLQLSVLWAMRRLPRTKANSIERSETVLSGFCVCALIVCTANNFLYDFRLVPSKAIGSVAICIFFIFSIGVIALRLLASMEQTAQQELAFLQAQIKPHFLYNAINTIISFCYTDGERAADLLTNLSKYFRSAFETDHQTQTVPLRHEIELIHAFMKIEQARFGDKIRVEYDIDEDLMDRQIPPLIIQPLVENAVTHGLREKDGGIVSVSARASGDAWTIVVRDTGTGMTAEQVDRVKKRKHVNGGVGLANVCRRIDRWETAGIDFSSTEGLGTTITITAGPGSIKMRKGAGLFERRHHRG